MASFLAAVHETTDALVEAMMTLTSVDRSRLVRVLRQLVAIERGLCEVARRERSDSQPVRGRQEKGGGLLRVAPTPPS